MKNEPPGNCATLRAIALPRSGEPMQTTQPGARSGSLRSARSAIKPPRLWQTKWILPGGSSATSIERTNSTSLSMLASCSLSTLA